jgi:dienelactone hydrolase
VYEKIVEIPTADGRMKPFITHPEQGGPFAPVVVYMDVWGLREELYDIARKVAVVGYYVLLPDLYYRQGRIRHQWRNERGQPNPRHTREELPRRSPEPVQVRRCVPRRSEETPPRG